MTNARKCIGTNIDGSPCSALPRSDSSFCAWHDPALANERLRWKSQGGKSKSNRSRARKLLLNEARNLKEIDAALGIALDRVLAGDIEPGVGTAAATIARAIIVIRDAGEFEERIAKLEAVTRERDRR
jgi:hypothetical protein